MAGKKVVEDDKVVKPTTTKKVETVDTDKDAIIKQQADQIDGLKSQFSKLEGMLEMLAKQNGTQNQVVVSQEEELVNIGCNSFEDIVLVLDGNREVTFKAGKFVSLSVEDARKMTQNRKQVKFMEKGIFYFDDEKWYKKFRIVKVDSLDNEGLAEILKKPEPEMYIDLKKLTDNNKSAGIYNMVLFRICRLIKTGEHPDIMKNYVHIDQYFNGKLGYAMAMAEAFSE